MKHTSINTLIEKAPYKVEANHPTGVCPKGENCHHKKGTTIGHYQTKNSAVKAVNRFQAHGFDVSLIDKAEGK